MFRPTILAVAAIAAIAPVASHAATRVPFERAAFEAARRRRASRFWWKSAPFGARSAPRSPGRSRRR